MPPTPLVCEVDLARQIASLEVEVEVGVRVALAAGDRAVDDQEVERVIDGGRRDRALDDLTIVSVQ